MKNYIIIILIYILILLGFNNRNKGKIMHNAVDSYIKEMRCNSALYWRIEYLTGDDLDKEAIMTMKEHCALDPYADKCPCNKEVRGN